MKKIVVLMCTYNGEKHIREQIDSILCQQGVDVSLLVRDDGSKDGTMKILGEYEGKGNIDWYNGENMGPAVGFMELLYGVGNGDYDYVAFSDQDDIWLEDKLIKAVRMIEERSMDGPILYGANQTLYKDGMPTNNVYEKKPILDTPYLLNHNKIAGCTMVINRQMARLITNSKRIDESVLKSRMHDLWLALVARTCGEVVFDMDPSMLYRIHESNVVGEADTTFITRIKRLKKNRGERANSRSRYAAELIRCFSDRITPEEKETLELYANYRKSMKNKIRFMRATDIIKQTGENCNVFRLKILMNYI